MSDAGTPVTTGVGGRQENCVPSATSAAKGTRNFADAASQIQNRTPARLFRKASASSDATAASDALLEQSRTQRAAGSLPVARATLERALRLDPNNAEVWLELGELELQTGNATQAAAMARKALTLTGRDLRLAARAERLLRAAE